MALDIWRNLRLAIVLLAIVLAYSLVMVGVGQLFFPTQAQGSLITRGGQVVGSALTGQSFTGPGYFHGRHSATVNAATGKPEPYNADNSSGSNLGPTNPALLTEVKDNAAALKGQVKGAIPANLVESSASGLDPEITLGAALQQVPAVARQTGLRESAVRALVLREAIGPFLGLYGPERVNVLELNLALQRLEH